SAHAVEAERVWFERIARHRRELVLRAAAVGAIGKRQPDLAAPPVRRRGVGAGRVLPFRFTWQPIAPTRLGAKPSDIFLCIVQTYIVHGGRIAGLYHQRYCLPPAFRKAGAPLRDGHRMLRERETPDGDTMGRRAAWVRGATH